MDRNVVDAVWAERNTFSNNEDCFPPFVRMDFPPKIEGKKATSDEAHPQNGSPGTSKAEDLQTSCIESIFKSRRYGYCTKMKQATDVMMTENSLF